MEFQFKHVLICHIFNLHRMYLSSMNLPQYINRNLQQNVYILTE